jgi:trans-2,3-dihydro-3-hydroxyanthranilate isomerase
VGTAAALAARGAISVPPEGGEAVLELGIGAVPVIVEPVERAGDLPFVWMKHRQPQFSPTRTDRAAVAAALGLAEADIRADLPLEVVSTGVPFLFVPLASLDAASRARSEREALAGLFAGEPANVALFTEETIDPGAKVHARMYAPHVVGIVEDPATGSMAAPLGAYLAKHKVPPEEPVSSFTIEQGIEMLRPSRIQVEVGRVGAEIVTLRIGGYSVLVGEGEIFW